MALFSRSLWPERVRRPRLRLAVAVVAAPLIVASVLTGLTYLAAGSSEPTREATMAVTREAAVIFFVALPAFSLTAGLAAVGVLWALGERKVSAWALAGAFAGVFAAVAQHLFVGGIRPIEAVIDFAIGALILALTRWIAGVRAD